MKNIVFGKLSSRVIAKFIDYILVFGLTVIIFFCGVFNATFDRESYVDNELKTIELYKDSGLYISTEKGSIIGLNTFSTISSVAKLTDVTLTVDGESFSHINATKQLYEFYSTKYISYGGQMNLTMETFKSMILKVGSELSNINDLVIGDDGSYTIEMIDGKKYGVTVSYVNSQIENAVKIVESSPSVRNYQAKNQKIMFNAIIWLVPIIISLSFIFDFLIPLFSKRNETIGKYIFKLGVISKDGYSLKKIWIFIRWLSYLVIELVGGFLTMGGTILISYTMLIFNKKKRTIHDYIGNSIVINKEESFYFNSYEEEKYLMENKRSINLL